MQLTTDLKPMTLKLPTHSLYERRFDAGGLILSLFLLRIRKLCINYGYNDSPETCSEVSLFSPLFTDVVCLLCKAITCYADQHNTLHAHD